MVQILKSEMVLPAEETPKHSIWMSNLDLAARRGYTPAVYFYPPNNDPNFFSPEALKESLAKVLVTFYPFAGKIGLDCDGRIEINCTGEGALFVTARCDDYTVDDLMNNFAPSTEMRNLFIPPGLSVDPPCILLMVQVTYMKCGGVVLGTGMHHAVLDARSASHFMETWASIARGSAEPAFAPYFDRKLLRARSPRSVRYDHVEYKPDPTPIDPVKSSTYASAILELSKAQVDSIKARCADAPSGANVSTFRAVVALVWQCVCRARDLPLDAETRLFTMIDMRSRITPPLPPGYFGNAVIRTSVAASVDEIVSNPIGHAARKMRSATSQDDDYARSLVDYLEGVDMMNLPRSGISRTHLRAISWLGMSLNDADFGWGEPAFMGPALMYYSGFVYVMNPLRKDGGVSLAMSLEPEVMPEFKKILADELARLAV